MSGRVVHFEIPADDLDRAQAFYGQAFGWTLQPIPDGNYVLVMTGPSGQTGPTESGFINGGLNKRENAPAPGPVVVIDVADIDSAIDQIVALGGAKAGDKVDVMGMGWSAYFTDPDGNVVGLWQNNPDAPQA